MLPGPVFNVELILTARRLRYYVLRVLYGLILLFIVWSNYRSSLSYNETELGTFYSANQLSLFAQNTFQTFAVVQSIAVLLLTPALVAGTIADEKQRKTLHYLLSSRLSGPEIVLGKLAARTLHVGVFLALGLPVLSMLSLFGGIDPTDIWLLYAGTASTVLLLAGVSILISVVSRRPRDAIIVVYLLELVWLAVPPLIAYAVRYGWPIVYSVIGPIGEWAYATHPMFPLLGSGGPTTTSPFSPASWTVDDKPHRVMWMVAFQATVGLAFVLLAVWRLRPSFRNEGGRPLLQRLFPRRRRWRLFPRPACGDDPMLWKERYVARAGGFAKVVSFLVGLLILGGLIFGLSYFAPRAFQEFVNSADDDRRWARQTFNAFLRTVCAALYVLCGLAVAASAASGVTSEREQDTWTSLTTTDLTGREIISAKMIGALWGMRWPVLTIVLLWGIGLACGSVHPFGFVASLVELVVFLGFASALGTFFSLGMKTTTRSMGLTIGILIFVNVGYLMCCAPFAYFVRSSTILIGCTPAIMGMSLLSVFDVRDYLGGTYGYSNNGYAESIVWTCLISAALYGAAAVVLAFSAVSSFDRAVDRPVRPLFPRRRESADIKKVSRDDLIDPEA